MNRRRAFLLLVGLVLVLGAGCLGDLDDPEPAGASSAPTGDAAGADGSANVSDPWGGADRLTIVDRTTTSSTAFQADVLCALGGGPQLDRTGAPVLSGTGELAVRVDAGDVTTGVQVGYLFDDQAPEYANGGDEISWLDTVGPGGSGTFALDVAGDQFEAPDGSRPWTFYLRMNPGLGELCYTGAHAGEFSVVVEALREA